MEVVEIELFVIKECVMEVLDLVNFKYKVRMLLDEFFGGE